MHAEGAAATYKDNPKINNINDITFRDVGNNRSLKFPNNDGIKLECMPMLRNPNTKLENLAIQDCVFKITDSQGKQVKPFALFNYIAVPDKQAIRDDLSRMKIFN